MKITIQKNYGEFTRFIRKLKTNNNYEQKQPTNNSEL